MKTNNKNGLTVNTNSPRPSQRLLFRKAVALALAIMVGVTFVPMLGDGAYAETQDAANAGNAVGISDAARGDSSVGLTEDAVLGSAAPGEKGASELSEGDELDIDEGAIEDMLNAEDSAPLQDITEPESDPAATDEGNIGQTDPAQQEQDALQDTLSGIGNEADAVSEGDGAMPPLDDALKAELMAKAQSEAQEQGDLRGATASVCDVKKWTQSGSNFVMDVSIKSKYRSGKTQYRIAGILIDGESVALNLNDFSYTLPLNDLPTGYHTVILVIAVSKDSGKTWAGDVDQSLVKTWLPSNSITAKPTYKGSFTVYSKYFNFYPYSAFSNQAGDLYIEWSGNNGKSWSRARVPSYSYITLPSQQGYSVTGLKPNKKYNTRFRYGVNVTYSKDYGGDGNAHFFGGPVLGTGTYKTGKAKKPKVKSVKVKAIKVKYHKHRVPGHYEWVGSSLIWFKAYTEKYYTCKVKLTIKMKKKPGTKGIYVRINNGYGNAKYLKGNKKKYTVKFSVYPNYFTKRPPKGMRKCKVEIWSAQNKSYGGYSPVFKKKYKVH